MHTLARNRVRYHRCAAYLRPALTFTPADTYNLFLFFPIFLAFMLDATESMWYIAGVMRNETGNKGSETMAKFRQTARVTGTTPVRKALEALRNQIDQYLGEGWVDQGGQIQTQTRLEDLRNDLKKIAKAGKKPQFEDRPNCGGRPKAAPANRASCCEKPEQSATTHQLLKQSATIDQIIGTASPRNLPAPSLLSKAGRQENEA